ncbi:MAG: hypothetical protein IJV15_01435 [Lachnospiraceae bacterium]|nr:hypothetical protein [Lachnospiraceae bacterium]
MDKRGKSEYTMRFSCPWQQVDNIIINWLNANKFSFVEKKDKKYFVKGNILVRRFFFEYSYFNNNGNNVVKITTYCDSGNGQWPIENEKLLNTAAGAKYMASVRDLLGAIYNMSAQYEQQPSMQTDYHKLASKYDVYWQAEVDKKLGNHALYGMLIGIVGLILIAFGLVFGLLILLFGLTFCFDGLHSKRKYMSYIGFVTIGISLVVWVISVINMFS